MADKGLIYPIEFDLDKAVKEAGDKWDSKYADALEKRIQKRALAVKLKIDTTSIKGLDEAIRRIESLSVGGGGGGTRRAAVELTGFKKQLAELTKEWEKLTAAERGGAAGAALRERYRALQKEAQGYVSTLRAAVSQEDKLAAARDKAARAAERGTTATRNANREFRNQDGYVSRLIKRLAVYASFATMSDFLRSVREVTAEFELQRVSLGAIIQDQTRANALFSEIKQFALKSPISIMDLTKYTKQVAAYKIETDKLFDTTKRLADVSVGLGVDMGRLVLAYGQVKAASYLRAAEIRQFTEAGIPMLELLAEKFTALNGEAVTTEQVMEMVSKRMVSFSMVEDIFNDMTSAGGMFYNMQEKQGNTLFGLWAKLGDAASMMYDEIGNTEGVNSGMKSLIETLTDLMRNWEAVAKTAAWFVAPTALTTMFMKYAWSSTRKQAADAAATAATRAREAAVLQLSRAIEKGSVDDINAANAAMQKAKADEVAARKAASRTGLLVSGLKSIATSLAMGLGIGIVITAVTTLVYELFKAWENAHKLEDSLNKIEAERITTTAQSVRNFERLAEAAVNAADGSRAQREALDELGRTYRDILPVEDLKIEKLRAMKGDYSALTMAIEEYIAVQQKQKMLNTVNEVYGEEINDMTKHLAEALKSMGLDTGEAMRFLTEFNKQGEAAGKSLREKIEDAVKNADVSLTDEQIEQLMGAKSGWRKYFDRFLDSTTITSFGQSQYIKALADTSSDIERLDEANRGLAKGMKGVNEQTMLNTTQLGKYAKVSEKIQKQMSDFTPMADGKPLDNSSYGFQVQTSNEQVLLWGNAIKSALAEAGVQIKDEWIRINEDLSETDPAKWAALNMKEILKAVDGAKFPQLKKWLQQLQRDYESLRPSDGLVNAVNSKFRQIADSVGANMDLVHNYMMKSGQDTKDYADSISKALTEEKQKLDDLIFRKSELAKGVAVLAPVSDEELKNANMLVKFLEALAAVFGASSGSTRSGGRTSDPRLQNLKEEISLVQKLYNEYKQLEKQEGASKAEADMRKMAGATIDMFKGKYGFDLPTDAKDLTSALEILYAKMAALPKKVFPSLDKDLKEMRWTIEKVNIDESQRKIEAQLKELADRISRTKTAKEFYDKVLGATGDVNLAGKVAMSIYGSDGNDLKQQLAKQIRELTNGLKLPDGIISADNIVDYNALREWADANKDELGKTYDELVKIAEQGQKDMAKTYEGYLKDLEKAKSYSDKRIELARYTANKIAEINASTLPQEEKERLTTGYREREDKEAAKLEYEAFKDTPMYVQMFADLDNASTTMLRNMRDMLNRLKGKWGEALEPTQLKEMQSRLNAISEQLAQRNPFKAIGEGIGKIRALNKQYGSLKNVETELSTATKSLLDNKDALTAALQAETAAREAYNKAVAESGADSTEAKTAKADWSAATTLVNTLRKSVNMTEEEVKLLQEIIDKFKGANDEVDDGFKGLGEYVAKIKEAQDAIKGAVEEWTTLGDDELWNAIFDGLDKMAQSAEQGGEAVMAYFQGDYFTMVTKGISSVANLVSGIGKIFWGSKVAKANKEIKRQQELLDQLEYAYSRLEKAADKEFGAGYIRNFDQQQKTLQAQASAYRKQAEAERSKGKKADEDKIKEYENAYRDTMDRIADMEGQVAERMLGTDLTSAARDFARAWLDAYKEFGNTADAMSEKFREMIENMVVESMLAKVMERALKPMFDMIDDMDDQDFYSESFWKNVVATAEQGAKDADYGAQTAMKFLEQAGLSMRDLGGEMTGISRDIAGASEESINGLAVEMHTFNYYGSHIPAISENVAAMRALMEGGHTAPIPTATAGWTDWQQQAMDNLNGIRQNTSEILVQCRRSADACNAAAENLRRVIVPRGTKGAVGVQVYM